MKKIIAIVVALLFALSVTAAMAADAAKRLTSCSSSGSKG